MKVEDWAGRCACEVEHPAGYGAYVCSRPSCYLALKATLMHYPDTKLVIKFGGPRKIMAASQYVALWESYLSPEDRIRALLDLSVNGQDDYIREIFVMEGTGAPMEPIPE